MVPFSGHLAALGAVLLLVVSSAASAQTLQVSTQESAVGFVGGVSIDPEQAFVGVFWQSPPLGGRFHLRPGIDGGFSDDLNLATINIDFVVRFPLGASGWDLLQGGGPAVVVARFDGLRGSDTDIGAGASYVFGFAHTSGFLTEFRVGGGGNVPNLKLAAGYAIGW